MAIVWTQVAPDIYTATSIGTLLVFDSKLYGFTSGAAPYGGQLIEWNGVDAWVEKAPQLLSQTSGLSLRVHSNELYGGTGLNGYLFKWNGTDAWTQLTTVDKYKIVELVILGSYLYGLVQMAGQTINGQLLQFDGVSDWTVKAPGYTAGAGALCMTVFNGKIYSGDSDGQLREWNGVDAWVVKAPQIGSQRINDLVVFNNKLYGTTVAVLSAGGRLFQWNDVDAWVEVAPQPGTNIEPVSPVVYRSKLYASAGNNGLWRWNRVDAWEQITSTAPNPGTLCVFGGKLYASKAGVAALLRLDGLPGGWVQII